MDKGDGSGNNYFALKFGRSEDVGPVESEGEELVGEAHVELPALVPVALVDEQVDAAVAVDAADVEHAGHAELDDSNGS